MWLCALRAVLCCATLPPSRSQVLSAILDLCTRHTSALPLLHPAPSPPLAVCNGGPAAACNACFSHTKDVRSTPADWFHEVW